MLTGEQLNLVIWRQLLFALLATCSSDVRRKTTLDRLLGIWWDSFATVFSDISGQRAIVKRVKIEESRSKSLPLACSHGKEAVLHFE